MLLFTSISRRPGVSDEANCKGKRAQNLFLLNPITLGGGSMDRLDSLLTKAEIRRLFYFAPYLDFPEATWWWYWGVLRTVRPVLAIALKSRIDEFHESSEHPTLKCREFGRGRIWLRSPQLVLVRPGQLGGTVEGEVLLGIEGSDPETWQGAVKLYRLLRRVFVAKGRGCRPGEIPWKTLAQRLRDNPEEFSYYLWLLAERKVQRWTERYGAAVYDARRRDRVQITELQEAYTLAYDEMRRALGRAGLRLSELKTVIFKREHDS